MSKKLELKLHFEIGDDATLFWATTCHKKYTYQYSQEGLVITYSDFSKHHYTIIKGHCKMIWGLAIVYTDQLSGKSKVLCNFDKLDRSELLETIEAYINNDIRERQ